jgi:hypothetical protein
MNEKLQHYIVGADNFIDADNCMQVILTLSETDWLFYKRLLAIPRDKWQHYIENTVEGPIEYIKSYKKVPR